MQVKDTVSFGCGHAVDVSDLQSESFVGVGCEWSAESLIDLLVSGLDDVLNYLSNVCVLHLG